jgi:galactose mutarotase-like enzyme
MTKKALLQELNAAPLTRVTMTGGSAVEDWPNIIASHPGWQVYPDKIANASSFILKPKLNRIRLGKFKSSSSRYTFSWDGNESHGGVTGLREVNNALELTMFNGAILRYEVVK